MGLSVDNNVHVTSQRPLGRTAALPKLDDLPTHSPGIADRIGSQIRDRSQFLFGGGAAGALLGAWGASRVPGGNITKVMTGVAGAIAGGVLGSAGGIAGGLGIDHLTGRWTKQSDSNAARTDASEAPTDVVADEQLRVMEYNVHGGMGGPKEFIASSADLDRLAEKIKREQPDVVVLQELDDFAARSNYTDTLAELAKRLGATGAIMTPGFDKVTGRREGSGILTFSGATVEDARGIRIDDAHGNSFARRTKAIADAWIGGATSKVFGGDGWKPFGGEPEYQPRVATDAIVKTAKGNHVRVLSGHFSPPQNGVDEPSRQVHPVVGTIDAWNGPTLFGADFNVRDGEAAFDTEHDVFDAAGMQEATKGAPANSDRIYVSKHFEASNPRKVDTPDGEVKSSDHEPVVVDLQLRK